MASVDMTEEKEGPISCVVFLWNLQAAHTVVFKVASTFEFWSSGMIQLLRYIYQALSSLLLGTRMFGYQFVQETKRNDCSDSNNNASHTTAACDADVRRWHRCCTPRIQNLCGSGGGPYYSQRAFRLGRTWHRGYTKASPRNKSAPEMKTDRRSTSAVIKTFSSLNDARLVLAVCSLLDMLANDPPSFTFLRGLGSGALSERNNNSGAHLDPRRGMSERTTAMSPCRHSQGPHDMSCIYNHRKQHGTSFSHNQGPHDTSCNNSQWPHGTSCKNSQQEPNDTSFSHSQEPHGQTYNNSQQGTHGTSFSHSQREPLDVTCNSHSHGPHGTSCTRAGVSDVSERSCQEATCCIRDWLKTLHSRRTRRIERSRPWKVPIALGDLAFTGERRGPHQTVDPRDCGTDMSRLQAETAAHHGIDAATERTSKMRGNNVENKPLANSLRLRTISCSRSKPCSQAIGNKETDEKLHKQPRQRLCSVHPVTLERPSAFKTAGLGGYISTMDTPKLDPQQDITGAAAAAAGKRPHRVVNPYPHIKAKVECRMRPTKEGWSSKFPRPRKSPSVYSRGAEQWVSSIMDGCGGETRRGPRLAWDGNVRHLQMHITRKVEEVVMKKAQAIVKSYQDFLEKQTRQHALGARQGEDPRVDGNNDDDPLCGDGTDQRAQTASCDDDRYDGTTHKSCDEDTIGVFRAFEEASSLTEKKVLNKGDCGVSVEDVMPGVDAQEHEGDDDDKDCWNPTSDPRPIQLLSPPESVDVERSYAITTNPASAASSKLAPTGHVESEVKTQCHNGADIHPDKMECDEEPRRHIDRTAAAYYDGSVMEQSSHKLKPKEISHDAPDSVPKEVNVETPSRDARKDRCEGSKRHKPSKIPVFQRHKRSVIPENVQCERGADCRGELSDTKQQRIEDDGRTSTHHRAQETENSLWPDSHFQLSKKLIAFGNARQTNIKNVPKIHNQLTCLPNMQLNSLEHNRKGLHPPEMPLNAPWWKRSESFDRKEERAKTGKNLNISPNKISISNVDAPRDECPLRTDPIPPVVGGLLPPHATKHRSRSSKVRAIRGGIKHSLTNDKRLPKTTNSEMGEEDTFFSPITEKGTFCQKAKPICRNGVRHAQATNNLYSYMLYHSDQFFCNLSPRSEDGDDNRHLANSHRARPQVSVLKRRQVFSPERGRAVPESLSSSWFSGSGGARPVEPSQAQVRSPGQVHPLRCLGSADRPGTLEGCDGYRSPFDVPLKITEELNSFINNDKPVAADDNKDIRKRSSVDRYTESDVCSSSLSTLRSISDLPFNNISPAGQSGLACSNQGSPLRVKPDLTSPIQVKPRARHSSPAPSFSLVEQAPSPTPGQEAWRHATVDRRHNSSQERPRNALAAATTFQVGNVNCSNKACRLSMSEPNLSTESDRRSHAPDLRRCLSSLRVTLPISRVSEPGSRTSTDTCYFTQISDHSEMHRGGGEVITLHTKGSNRKRSAFTRLGGDNGLAKADIEPPTTSWPSLGEFWSELDSASRGTQLDTCQHNSPRQRRGSMANIFYSLPSTKGSHSGSPACPDSQRPRVARTPRKRDTPRRSYVTPRFWVTPETGTPHTPRRQPSCAQSPASSARSFPSLVKFWEKKGSKFTPPSYANFDNNSSSKKSSPRCTRRHTINAVRQPQRGRGSPEQFFSPGKTRTKPKTTRCHARNILARVCKNDFSIPGIRLKSHQLVQPNFQQRQKDKVKTFNLGATSLPTKTCTDQLRETQAQHANGLHLLDKCRPTYLIQDGRAHCRTSGLRWKSKSATASAYLTPKADKMSFVYDLEPEALEQSHTTTVSSDQVERQEGGTALQDCWSSLASGRTMFHSATSDQRGYLAPAGLEEPRKLLCCSDSVETFRRQRIIEFVTSSCQARPKASGDVSSNRTECREADGNIARVKLTSMADTFSTKTTFRTMDTFDDETKNDTKPLQNISVDEDAADTPQKLDIKDDVISKQSVVAKEKEIATKHYKSKAPKTNIRPNRALPKHPEPCLRVGRSPTAALLTNHDVTGLNTTPLRQMAGKNAISFCQIRMDKGSCNESYRQKPSTPKLLMERGTKPASVSASLTSTATGYVISAGLDCTSGSSAASTPQNNCHLKIGSCPKGNVPRSFGQKSMILHASPNPPPKHIEANFWDRWKTSNLTFTRQQCKDRRTPFSNSVRLDTRSRFVTRGALKSPHTMTSTKSTLQLKNVQVSYTSENSALEYPRSLKLVPEYSLVPTSTTSSTTFTVETSSPDATITREPPSVPLSSRDAMGPTYNRWMPHAATHETESTSTYELDATSEYSDRSGATHILHTHNCRRSPHSAQLVCKNSPTTDNNTNQTHMDRSGHNLQATTDTPSDLTDSVQSDIKILNADKVPGTPKEPASFFIEGDAEKKISDRIGRAPVQEETSSSSDMHEFVSKLGSRSTGVPISDPLTENASTQTSSGEASSEPTSTGEDPAPQVQGIDMINKSPLNRPTTSYKSREGVDNLLLAKNMNLRPPKSVAFEADTFIRNCAFGAKQNIDGHETHRQMFSTDENKMKKMFTGDDIKGPFNLVAGTQTTEANRNPLGENIDDVTHWQVPIQLSWSPLRAGSKRDVQACSSDTDISYARQRRAFNSHRVHGIPLTKISRASSTEEQYRQHLKYNKPSTGRNNTNPLMSPAVSTTPTQESVHPPLRPCPKKATDGSLSCEKQKILSQKPKDRKAGQRITGVLRDGYLVSKHSSWDNCVSSSAVLETGKHETYNRDSNPKPKTSASDTSLRSKPAKDSFQKKVFSELSAKRICRPPDVCSRLSKPEGSLPQSSKVHQSDNITSPAPKQNSTEPREDILDRGDARTKEVESKGGKVTQAPRDIEIVLGDDVTVKEFMKCFMDGLDIELNNSGLSSQPVTVNRTRQIFQPFPNVKPGKSKFSAASGRLIDQSVKNKAHMEPCQRRRNFSSSRNNSRNPTPSVKSVSEEYSTTETEVRTPNDNEKKFNDDRSLSPGNLSATRAIGSAVKRRLKLLDKDTRRNVKGAADVSVVTEILKGKLLSPSGEKQRSEKKPTKALDESHAGNQQREPTSPRKSAKYEARRLSPCKKLWKQPSRGNYRDQVYSAERAWWERSAPVKPALQPSSSLKLKGKKKASSKRKVSKDKRQPIDKLDLVAGDSKELSKHERKCEYKIEQAETSVKTSETVFWSSPSPERRSRRNTASYCGESTGVGQQSKGKKKPQAEIFQPLREKLIGHHPDAVPAGVHPRMEVLKKQPPTSLGNTHIRETESSSGLDSSANTHSPRRSKKSDDMLEKTSDARERISSNDGISPRKSCPVLNLYQQTRVRQAGQPCQGTRGPPRRSSRKKHRPGRRTVSPACKKGVGNLAADDTCVNKPRPDKKTTCSDKKGKKKCKHKTLSQSLTEKETDKMAARGVTGTTEKRNEGTDTLVHTKRQGNICERGATVFPPVEQHPSPDTEISDCRLKGSVEDQCEEVTASPCSRGIRICRHAMKTLDCKHSGGGKETLGPGRYEQGSKDFGRRDETRPQLGEEPIRVYKGQIHPRNNTHEDGDQTCQPKLAFSENCKNIETTHYTVDTCPRPSLKASSRSSRLHLNQLKASTELARSCSKQDTCPDQHRKDALVYRQSKNVCDNGVSNTITRSVCKLSDPYSQERTNYNIYHIRSPYGRITTSLSPGIKDTERELSNRSSDGYIPPKRDSYHTAQAKNLTTANASGTVELRADIDTCAMNTVHLQPGAVASSGLLKESFRNTIQDVVPGNELSLQGNAPPEYRVISPRSRSRSRVNWQESYSCTQDSMTYEQSRYKTDKKRTHRQGQASESDDIFQDAREPDQKEAGVTSDRDTSAETIRNESVFGPVVAGGMRPVASPPSPRRPVRDTARLPERPARRCDTAGGEAERDSLPVPRPRTLVGTSREIARVTPAEKKKAALLAEPAPTPEGTQPGKAAISHRGDLRPPQGSEGSDTTEARTAGHTASQGFSNRRKDKGPSQSKKEKMCISSTTDQDVTDMDDIMMSLLAGKSIPREGKGGSTTGGTSKRPRWDCRRRELTERDDSRDARLMAHLGKALQVCELQSVIERTVRENMDMYLQQVRAEAKPAAEPVSQPAQQPQSREEAGESESSYQGLHLLGFSPPTSSSDHTYREKEHAPRKKNMLANRRHTISTTRDAAITRRLSLDATPSPSLKTHLDLEDTHGEDHPLQDDFKEVYKDGVAKSAMIATAEAFVVTESPSVPATKHTDDIAVPSVCTALVSADDEKREEPCKSSLGWSNTLPMLEHCAEPCRVVEAPEKTAGQSPDPSFRFVGPCSFYSSYVNAFLVPRVAPDGGHNVLLHLSQGEGRPEAKVTVEPPDCGPKGVPRVLSDNGYIHVVFGDEPGTDEKTHGVAAEVARASTRESSAQTQTEALLLADRLVQTDAGDLPPLTALPQDESGAQIWQPGGRERSAFTAYSSSNGRQMDPHSDRDGRMYNSNLLEMCTTLILGEMYQRHQSESRLHKHRRRHAHTRSNRPNNSHSAVSLSGEPNSARLVTNSPVMDQPRKEKPMTYDCNLTEDSVTQVNRTDSGSTCSGPARQQNGFRTDSATSPSSDSRDPVADTPTVLSGAEATQSFYQSKAEINYDKYGTISGEDSCSEGDTSEDVQHGSYHRAPLPLPVADAPCVKPACPWEDTTMRGRQTRSPCNSTKSTQTFTSERPRDDDSPYSANRASQYPHRDTDMVTPSAVVQYARSGRTAAPTTAHRDPELTEGSSRLVPDYPQRGSLPSVYLPSRDKDKRDRQRLTTRRQQVTFSTAETDSLARARATRQPASETDVEANNSSTGRDTSASPDTDTNGEDTRPNDDPSGPTASHQSFRSDKTSRPSLTHTDRPERGEMEDPIKPSRTVTYGLPVTHIDDPSSTTSLSPGQRRTDRQPVTHIDDPSSNTSLSLRQRRTDRRQPLTNLCEPTSATSRSSLSLRQNRTYRQPLAYEDGPTDDPSSGTSRASVSPQQCRRLRPPMPHMNLPVCDERDDPSSGTSRASLSPRQCQPAKGQHCASTPTLNCAPFRRATRRGEHRVCGPRYKYMVKSSDDDIFVHKRKKHGNSGPKKPTLAFRGHGMPGDQLHSSGGTVCHDKASRDSELSSPASAGTDSPRRTKTGHVGHIRHTGKSSSPKCRDSALSCKSITFTSSPSSSENVEEESESSKKSCRDHLVSTSSNPEQEAWKAEECDPSQGSENQQASGGEYLPLAQRWLDHSVHGQVGQDTCADGDNTQTPQKQEPPQQLRLPSQQQQCPPQQQRLPPQQQQPPLQQQQPPPQQQRRTPQQQQKLQRPRQQPLISPPTQRKLRQPPQQPPPLQCTITANAQQQQQQQQQQIMQQQQQQLQQQQLQQQHQQQQKQQLQQQQQRQLPQQQQQQQQQQKQQQHIQPRPAVPTTPTVRQMLARNPAAISPGRILIKSGHFHKAACPETSARKQQHRVRFAEHVTELCSNSSNNQRLPADISGRLEAPRTGSHSQVSAGMPPAKPLYQTYRRPEERPPPPSLYGHAPRTFSVGWVAETHQLPFPGTRPTQRCEGSTVRSTGRDSGAARGGDLSSGAACSSATGPRATKTGAVPALQDRIASDKTGAVPALQDRTASDKTGAVLVSLGHTDSDKTGAVPLSVDRLDSGYSTPTHRHSGSEASLSDWDKAIQRKINKRLMHFV